MGHTYIDIDTPHNVCLFLSSFVPPHKAARPLLLSSLIPRFYNAPLDLFYDIWSVLKSTTTANIQENSTKNIPATPSADIQTPHKCKCQFIKSMDRGLKPFQTQTSTSISAPSSSTILTHLENCPVRSSIPDLVRISFIHRIISR